MFAWGFRVQGLRDKKIVIKLHGPSKYSNAAQVHECDPQLG